jgi:hypothetical protein
MRIAATTAGGFIAGLGGACLTLFYPGSWNEGISSGQGLIAVALVIFARWSPLRCVGAALLFGGAGAIGPALQSIGIGWGYHLFNIVPYVLTLVILVSPASRASAAIGSPGRTFIDKVNTMSGLGGLNKSKHGVVIGLVQLQLPNVEDAGRPGGADAAHLRAWWARRAATSRPWTSWCSPSTRCTASRWTPIREIMCSLDGPEVAAFRRPAPSNRIWGCFSIMEPTPAATRTTAA